jgi:hypothetical protein
VRPAPGEVEVADAVLEIVDEELFDAATLGTIWDDDRLAGCGDVAEDEPARVPISRLRLLLGANERLALVLEPLPPLSLESAAFLERLFSGVVALVSGRCEL